MAKQRIILTHPELFASYINHVQAWLVLPNFWLEANAVGYKWDKFCEYIISCLIPQIVHCSLTLKQHRYPKMRYCVAWAIFHPHEWGQYLWVSVSRSFISCGMKIRLSLMQAQIRAYVPIKDCNVVLLPLGLVSQLWTSRMVLLSLHSCQPRRWN